MSCDDSFRELYEKNEKLERDLAALRKVVQFLLVPDTEVEPKLMFMLQNNLSEDVFFTMRNAIDSYCSERVGIVGARNPKMTDIWMEENDLELTSVLRELYSESDYRSMTQVRDDFRKVINWYKKNGMYKSYKPFIDDLLGFTEHPVTDNKKKK